jgi:hypothetical protein
VKKTPQQLADQFIDETIELHKFINSEIEGVKNSPIYRLQNAIIKRKADLDELLSGATIQDQKSIASSSMFIEGLPNTPPVRRKNALTDIISKAQQQAINEGSERWDSGKIYSILEGWADSGLDQYLPLLAATDDGIKYRDGDRDKYLTKKLLIDRLSRLKNSPKKSR